MAATLSDNTRDSSLDPRFEPRTYFPSNHLLGLPLEIRRQVWWLIFLDMGSGSDIDSSSYPKWHERTATAWDGIQFSCKQIYNELSDFWPKSQVRINQVAQKLTPDGLTISTLKYFRSLTLELPKQHSEIPATRQASQIFYVLAPFLQELRIYFIDDHENGPTYKRTSKSCLLRSPDGAKDCPKEICDEIDNTNRNTVFVTKKSDANAQSLHMLLEAIVHMEKLEVLVLDEIDLLVLGSTFIYQKPLLKNLLVTTSPDSILHQYAFAPAPLTHEARWRFRKQNTTGLQLAGPPRHGVRPIFEKLYLSANAILDANQLAVMSLSTLLSFTWIVPKQNTNPNMRCDWIGQTSEVLHALAIKANRLRTLRICLERTIGEDDFTETRLIGSFNGYLAMFKRLKHLELHMKMDSPWLGTEILERLPWTLRRFYTSECCISPEVIFEALAKRYLLKPEDMPDPGLLGFVGYEFTSEQAWMTMLFLNGRLLDRERQLSRLARASMRGRPNASDGHTDEKFIRSQGIFRPKYVDVHEVELMPIHEILPAPKDETDYGRPYTDEIEQLAKLWEDEQPATWEDLPELRTISNERILPGEHWLSD